MTVNGHTIELSFDFWGLCTDSSKRSWGISFPKGPKGYYQGFLLESEDKAKKIRDIALDLARQYRSTFDLGDAVHDYALKNNLICRR